MLSSLYSYLDDDAALVLLLSFRLLFEIVDNVGVMVVVMVVGSGSRRDFAAASFNDGRPRFLLPVTSDMGRISEATATEAL